MATILLYVEQKMGEVIKANPPSFIRGKDGKIEGVKTLPKDITHKESHLIKMGSQRL